jgi:hypothetical protein
MDTALFSVQLKGSHIRPGLAPGLRPSQHLDRGPVGRAPHVSALAYMGKIRCLEVWISHRAVGPQPLADLPKSRHFVAPLRTEPGAFVESEGRSFNWEKGD